MVSLGPTKQQGDSGTDIFLECKCIKRKGVNTEKAVNALSNNDYGREACDYHSHWRFARLTAQACLIRSLPDLDRLSHKVIKSLVQIPGSPSSL